LITLHTAQIKVKHVIYVLYQEYTMQVVKISYILRTEFFE